MSTDKININSTDNLFLNSIGLANNISSSTLRHASPKYIFSTASRFSEDKRDIPSTQLELPSTRSTKYTTQGFGKKINFQWKFQERNAKQFPSPDRYETRTIPGKDTFRKTFGAAFSSYAHTYVPHSKEIPIEVAKLLPGPGGYEVGREIATHPYQTTIKGKGKMFNDQKDTGFPGPEKYLPSVKLVLPSRYSVVSQGIGMKKDPFRSSSITPGPGRYNIPSVFDKENRRLRLSQPKLSIPPELEQNM